MEDVSIVFNNFCFCEEDRILLFEVQPTGARNIRKNVLETFTTTYKLKTLTKGALVREWPHDFSVWKEDETIPEGYSELGKFAEQPSGQEISDLFEVYRLSNSMKLLLPPYQIHFVWNSL